MANESDNTVLAAIPDPFRPETLERELLPILGARTFDRMDYSKTGVHLHLDVSRDDLFAVAQVLHRNDFAFECATAIDRPPFETEVIYLFRRLTACPRIRLRVLLTGGEVELPSLVPVYKGANWYERELWDMYGLRFSGHPNLQRILLPAHADFHPLRKQFRGRDITWADHEEEAPSIDIEAAAIAAATGQRRDFFLNMGPQHPSTHGVLRVLLHVEGEMVLGGRCHLGYSHRSTEKIAEERTYQQFLPYTDRIDYLAPIIYNWGYAALLERATGIVPTARAQMIRVIMGELSRITSHLVWLGTFLLDLGAVTPFLYTFEDRELILTLFEKTTGQRMTNSYVVVGGVRNDLPADFIQDVSQIVSHMRKRLPDYESLVFENEIFVRRTAGVGHITYDQLRDFGITGPIMRGCGIAADLRRDEPCCIEYTDLRWDIPVETDGDCMARSKVRLHEMYASLDLVEQALQKLSEGPVRAKVPRNLKVPEGHYYQATLGPRGLVGWYLVSDGSMTPYRLKVRVPSFANLQVIEETLPGYRVADVVAILGSLDVIIPEIDR